MNGKKKLVVVVLVLTMMVTAVAYAAWSDTIDVNGTAGTGDFDVHWKDAETEVKYTGTGDGEPETTFMTAKRTSDDLYTINIQNAKPGETYTVPLVAENIGSLNAFRKSMELEIAGNSEDVGKPITVTTKDGTKFTIEVQAREETTLEKAGSGKNTETFTIIVDVPHELNKRDEGFDETAGNVDFTFKVNYEQFGVPPPSPKE